MVVPTAGRGSMGVFCSRIPDLRIQCHDRYSPIDNKAAPESVAQPHRGLIQRLTSPFLVAWRVPCSFHVLKRVSEVPRAV
jgi:hypothetical protein